MTIDEAYKCPNCGKQDISIDEIEQIFDDARVDVVHCINCNTKWNVYYKMTEMTTKFVSASFVTPPDEYFAPEIFPEAVATEICCDSEKLNNEEVTPEGKISTLDNDDSKTSI